MALVILTGASGSGKTAIAKNIEEKHPSIRVFRFDSIGVPSAEVMASFGNGHQPGGAWQRAMTFQWLGRIAPLLAGSTNVLFEGKCESLSFARRSPHFKSTTHASFASNAMTRLVHTA